MASQKQLKAKDVLEILFQDGSDDEESDSSENESEYNEQSENDISDNDDEYSDDNQPTTSTGIKRQFSIPKEKINVKKMKKNLDNNNDWNFEEFIAPQVQEFTANYGIQFNDLNNDSAPIDFFL
jgi:hypothetical protein